MTKDVKTIWGGPTKRFFVEMLTRDIALPDAILDLIDNCVDGAARQIKGKKKSSTPYDGFEAKLTLTPTSFEISDNCGGIPQDRISDAFLLGRPKMESGLSTIGMYGIGMKRAIFKIGQEATVESYANDGAFSVAYDKIWLDPQNEDWDLDVKELPNKRAKGVSIVIPKLKKDIGRQFGNEKFINELRNAIAENFGYLMQKGFSVKVNGVKILPRTLQLHASSLSKEKAIRPYDYQAEEDGVSIRVIVGFYRRLSRIEDIDEEAEKATEGNQAGISVICNDRLVLLKDRTVKTGWGEGGVPHYHPQFRCISGLISFTTDHPERLPISTTKRDLDIGTEIYLRARQFCMEGLREFTSFTNKWKGMEEEANKFFEQAKLRDARTDVKRAEQQGVHVRGSQAAKKAAANLPLPEKRNPLRRISFSRKESDVRDVAEYLFEEAVEDPSVVGQECFDRTLKAARK